MSSLPPTPAPGSCQDGTGMGQRSPGGEREVKGQRPWAHSASQPTRPRPGQLPAAECVSSFQKDRSGGGKARLQVD